ncbi:hypothetical protein [Lentzea sp. CA-135723]|uniref:hypothetical protein n=1 Tax=Lentzea sp. CA-135723 TaxID=3239950 RepID=UPI003D9354FC
MGNLRELDRRIIDLGEVPDGVEIPLIAQAYVDPALYGRVLAHLRSPVAALRPLVLVGGPGSGKSVLVEVLAARLPASGFPVVRGEGLAVVPEGVSVVLADGVRPELLELQRARGVAVVMTSREGVEGAEVLRLPAFSDDDVAGWLEVWNSANAGYFADHGLLPLPLSVALEHRSFAEQPLLLLMLALYDSVGNALQRGLPLGPLSGEYEFLAAAFGDHVAALRIWGGLRSGDVQGMLALTPMSPGVISVLGEMADASDDRAGLARVVRRLFAFGQHSAVYSLNLVLLHVVLVPLCSARDIGVEDWPRLAAFWRSQLSDADWRAVVGLLFVSWDEPSSPVLGIGAGTTVDAGGLREAVVEARFVGDAAGKALSYMAEALPAARYDVHYARAVMELAASPVEPWERAAHYLWWADRFPDLVLECLRRDVTVGAETLRELAKTSLAESSAFVVQLCDRIGRGGRDEELLDVFDGLGAPRIDQWCEIAMVDAWLRLHEQGYRHTPGRRTDLVRVLRSADFEMISQVRPDLVYRCGTVAHEIGLFG